MSGRLKNRSRTAKTFNLTTKVAAVRHLFPRRTDHKDGHVSVSDRRVVLPDSITILAGRTSESLPDGIPHCPEVAGAITRREVVWIPDPALPKKASPQKVEKAEKADEKSEPKSRTTARG